MTFDKSESEIVLSSGRRFYSWCGCANLSIDGDDADCLSYGYDGGVDTTDWTPAERLEVAEHMIALWQSWAQKGRDRD